MDNLIRFHCPPELKGKVPEPVPAKRSIPAWLKDSHLDIPEEARQAHDLSTHTAKACLPFLEATTAGYLIPFPEDVTISFHGPHPTFHWDLRTVPNKSPWVEGHHPSQYKNAPFEKMPVLKLKNPWIVSTPPGVSCLFISPLNHFHLAGIFPLAGVVDTDTYYNPVNFPALLTGIKRDKPVTIKRGTPIIQVIPFRREVWNMEIGTTEVAKIKNT